jgi:3-hydroxybutyryl-CoA dehydrogenase
LGVAECAVRRGFHVSVWDSDPRVLERVRGGTRGITATTTLEELAGNADFVLEAIHEDLDAKVEVFRAADAVAGRECLFMTATSGLSISSVGANAGCAGRLVGTHFWNPPELMPLVEVTPGIETSPQAVSAVGDFLRDLGKSWVLVKHDVPGFIGNRLLHAMWREAAAMVERGIASPEDIDRVARMTFGLRMAAVGPLENMDLVGLDLVERIQEYLLADLAKNAEPGPLLRTLVAEGRVGVKARSGFYHWTDQSANELRARRDEAISEQLGAPRE